MNDKERVAIRGTCGDCTHFDAIPDGHGVGSCRASRPGCSITFFRQGVLNWRPGVSVPSRDIVFADQPYCIALRPDGTPSFTDISARTPRDSI